MSYKMIEMTMSLDTVAGIAHDAVNAMNIGDRMVPRPEWSTLEPLHEIKQGSLGLAEVFLSHTPEEWYSKRFPELDYNRSELNYMRKEEALFFSIINSFRPFFGKVKDGK